MRAELASRAGLTLRRARFDPIEAQRRAIPTRGVLNLLDRRQDPQPDQCLADCTVDVAGTRIGLRLKDSGDALGEGRTKRRLELRPSREIEAQLGLWQGHGTGLAPPMAFCWRAR